MAVMRDAPAVGDGEHLECLEARSLLIAVKFILEEEYLEQCSQHDQRRGVADDVLAEKQDP